MNTDPTLLRAFVEVARASSFGRAAEVLHLDPSSVSRQVAQLERRLGVRLFDRTTRQVWLTEAGEALLPEADAVMNAIDGFTRSAAAIDRQHRGEVVVGFQAHAINTEVLGWISGAEAACEGVSVALHEGNFSDPSTGLHDRSTDLAIVFLPFDDTGLESATLFELPWLIFLPATHRLAGQETVAIEDLLDEPWIPPATGDEVFHKYWMAMEDRGDRPPPDAPESATPEAGLALIATGRAIGSGASARRPLHLDGVVAVPVADGRRTTVALAWRSGTLARPVAMLRDAVLAQAHMGSQFDA